MSVKEIDLFELPSAVKYTESGPLIVGGRYRHYKGGEYVVLDVAKNSENPTQEMVYYRALYDNEQSWVRPKNMFMEIVDMPGGDGFMTVPRFQYVGKLDG